MDKVIELNGTKYISIERLIDALTLICVDDTNVDDLYIYECERDNLSACQEICNDLEKDIPGLKKAFKTKYIFERFNKRTLGV